jgi:hypothetical protein
MAAQVHARAEIGEHLVDGRTIDIRDEPPLMARTSLRTGQAKRW